MLPGPNCIYHCPECPNLLSNGSLLSGNTTGAKIYSDGKQIAPMLPQFPTLTKCPKCETIFWLSKAQEIGKYNWRRFLGKSCENAERARFLTNGEYWMALENKIYDSKEEEILIRKAFWWSLNDKERNGIPNTFSDEEKNRLFSNLKRLLELLDKKKVHQKIMTAEIYRIMGDFEQCEIILGSINYPHLEWMITAYKSKCQEKNDRVFQLK